MNRVNYIKILLRVSPLNWNCSEFYPSGISGAFTGMGADGFQQGWSATSTQSLKLEMMLPGFVEVWKCLPYTCATQ